MAEYTDTTPMPWGKFKGHAMQDVPAEYLIWLLENKKCSGNLKAYIEENLQVLRKEISERKSIISTHYFG